jgi:hypothetical protein
MCLRKQVVRDCLKSKYLLFMVGVICSVTVPIGIEPAVAQSPAKSPAKSAAKSTKKAKSTQVALPQTNSFSASEGVQLIEEIFQKLKNVPQLALAKSKQLLAYQGAPPAQQQWGAGDSNLMIKPAQSNAPKAQQGAFAYPVDKVSRAGQNTTNSAARGGARWRFSPQNISPNQAAGPASVATPTDNFSGTGSSNVWEKGRSQMQALPQEPAESEQDAIKDAKNISTYGGRADQSGNVLSNAPLIKEFNKDQAAAPSANANGAQVQNAPMSQSNLSDAIRRSHSPQFNRLARSLSGGNLPDVTVQVQTSTVPRSQQLKTGYVAGAAGMVPPPPPELIALRGAPNGAFAPSGADISETQVVDARISIRAKKGAMRPSPLRSSLLSRDTREEIALLPLTKFSGIPLVNLGDSDSDLSKRLGDVGVVEITMVKPWTVWSVKKRGSQDCSLQIFTQKGVVEAVRVKDKSVWTNQQGIGLGDDVSVVKEKFGEPAFILSHAVPSANKVYVYPISQVAFRLERAAETDPPRIKDIIIFNVK